MVLIVPCSKLITSYCPPFWDCRFWWFEGGQELWLTAVKLAQSLSFHSLDFDFLYFYNMPRTCPLPSLYRREELTLSQSLVLTWVVEALFTTRLNNEVCWLHLLIWWKSVAVRQLFPNNTSMLVTIIIMMVWRHRFLTNQNDALHFQRWFEVMKIQIMM